MKSFGAPPNPRLQRTPSASPPSPLSRQPLGALMGRAGSRATALFAVIVSVVAVPLGCRANRPGPVVGKITAFGVFRDVTDPSAGLPVELATQTDTIEACQGVWFGYELKITGLTAGADATFRKLVAHPPMHMPDGTVSKGYEKTQKTKVWKDGSVHTFQGYRLDHEYERVLGPWRFEFWNGKTLIASKTLTLIPCPHS